MIIFKKKNLKNILYIDEILELYYITTTTTPTLFFYHWCFDSEILMIKKWGRGDGGGVI